MAKCALCSATPLTESGLLTHGYAKHRGIPREQWQRGYQRKPCNARKETIERGARVVLDSGEVVHAKAAIARRGYKDILEPKKPPTKTEKLVALPWVTYPMELSDFEAIADACVEMANKCRKNPALHAYWLSTREYIIALGARVAKMRAA